MKFDIVRAWKDENYRQSLSEEELKALPPCPSGELSDLELTAVAGGGGQDVYNENGFGLGASSSSAAFSSHCHSYAVIICDANVFSNDVAVIALQNVLNIGSPRHEICAHEG
jgi:mersacidin/lichenicidin family type 2 lantibiotic